MVRRLTKVEWAGERDFHRLLAKVFRIHAKLAFGALAKYGITQGQPRILHYLTLHDGCIQRDISADNDLEPSTVTDILSIMEKSGLVRRESSSEDRRVSRVYIAPKGRRAFERAEAAFHAVEEQSFRGFSPQEKELAMRFLGRIYDNLKGQQAGGA
jgi:DNA-binding MarR family transcriptional regulator